MNNYPQKQNNVMVETLQNCNINTQEINNAVNDLNTMFTKYVNQNNKIDTTYQLLMTDDFFNKFNNLVNIINKYDYNTIQCVLQADVNANKNFCNNLLLISNNSNKLTQISNLLDKYQKPLTILVNKAFDIQNQSSTYCGVSQINAQNFRNVVIKIADILGANNSSIPYMSNIISNTSYSSSYTIYVLIAIILILIIVIVLLLIYYK